MECLVSFPLSSASLLSTVYQCDRCLSSAGMWGLMADLSGFASCRCSIHLGAGSSRMSQAP